MVAQALASTLPTVSGCIQSTFAVDPSNSLCTPLCVIAFQRTGLQSAEDYEYSHITVMWEAGLCIGLGSGEKYWTVFMAINEQEKR